MVEEREGKMGGIDERYAIDNGAMIAYAGILEFLATKKETKLEDSWITQRFRTDEVAVSWRND
jgi:N6-L-threonylcarbamoyladenine synthase